MKKSLLQLLSTSFILISLHSFAGTSPASSTGKGRSNSLRNAHHIVGGNGFAVEIRSGEIWSWGANDKGQLGTGNNTPSSVPVQEATHSTNWVDINAGSGHVMAVKSDGTLWVWGLNDKGQLGIGNQTDQNIPVQIGTERDWVSLGCGSSQSFAIKANGSMWVCGSNQSGALGLNILQTIFNQLSLTQLGNSLNWKFVSGSDNFVAALQADGTVYTWGDNSSGQLGLGGLLTGLFSSPSQVASLSNVISLETGDGSVFALQNNGKLYAWGLNDKGQLGDLTTTNRSTPVQIAPSVFWIGMASGQTGDANATQTLAVSAGGSLYTWGNNQYGQLGLGNSDSGPHSTPTQVTSVSNIVNVECGNGSSYALAADGTLYAWGYNDEGQLGNNSNADVYTPTSVSIVPIGWSRVVGGEAFTTALKSDGTLWSFGYNAYGQLGNGSTVDSSLTQVQVIGGNYVHFASGQSHTLAIKADGTLWAWGRNNGGQLGIGTSDNSLHNTPVQIGTGTLWIAVSAGDAYSMAIREDGTLWAWGTNNFGQFGNGNISATPIGTPVQIGTLDSWVDVECGADFTLAIKSDGTLWSWGNNNSGQLGLNTTTSSSSPQQVTSVASTWCSIAAAGGGAHSLGVSAKGDIYAWGNNSHGQLGDGTTTNQLAPQKLTSFGTSGLYGLTVYCGSYHSFAIVNTGDIYSWGENLNGQLGIGQFRSISYHSSPTLVSTNNVVTIGCGYNHSVIIHADRANVCVTGLNSQGQLGNGTNVDVNTFQCVVSVIPCISPTVPAISASSPAICGIHADTLSISSGSLNDATQWAWYQNSCGGIFLGYGNSIIVTPTATTSYFARGEGGCILIPGICNAITVTQNPIPIVGATASPSGTICLGNSVTLNGTGATTYSWSVGVLDGTAFTPGATETYTVTGTANGCSNTAVSTVTVTQLPVGSATAQVICDNGTSSVALNGGSTYSWTSSVTFGSVSGNSSSGTGSPIAETLHNTSGVHGIVTYTVIPTSATGCVGSAFTVNVTVGASPLAPSIAGPQGFCGVPHPVFTATSHEATSYTWTVPAGVTAFTGQGTSSITTTMSSTSTGAGVLTLTVTATNACGTSTLSTFNTAKKPLAPTVTGPTSVCGFTTANYTATATLATSYTWTLPSGITMSGGTGTSSIVVNIAPTFVSGNITAVAVNACGSLPGTSITVYGKSPLAPGSIAGPTNVCGLTTALYTAALVAGATSYLWTLPSGFTGTSTTNSITVAISGYITGNITAAGVNTCGTGAIRTLVLTQAATEPLAISGPVTTCGLTTAAYSIAAVAGSAGYSWTVPANMTISSGQGTTGIITTFTTPPSGSVTVMSNNGCVNSVARTLAINKLEPTPGAITGPTTGLCTAGTATYSITPEIGATGYNWTVPSGMIITSGQGSNSIIVNSVSTASGSVKVAAKNTCGTSAGSSLAITCLSPDEMNSGVGVQVSSFSIYPNPATNEFTISVDNHSNINNTLTMEMFDVLGKRVLQSVILSQTKDNLINIGQLNRGMYFVRLIDESGNVVYTQRVIKE